MASYQNIVRLRPEVRDFIRNRRWVHRGDVVAYAPNIQCESFSTDGAGFRHSVFQGKTLSVLDCLQQDRYGVVLGPSSVYGFGLAGNENSIPSLLAERLGFPFANLGLPEGNSRNLCSLLFAILARAPHPPMAVVHVSGGDFTNFCYTSIADPVFGSPNLRQISSVLIERGGYPEAKTQIGPLLAFTSLWIRTIGVVCQAQKIPLVLADDTTFFEKAEPTELDVHSCLGEPSNNAQARQFATHRAFVREYHSRRKNVAKTLGVPLAGPGTLNRLGFIDEFHYDREGTRSLAEDFSEALESIF